MQHLLQLDDAGRVLEILPTPEVTIGQVLRFRENFESGRIFSHESMLLAQSVAFI